MSAAPATPTPKPQPFDDAQGVTQPASPGGHPGFLSDVIIELGFAPREVVDEAVAESREAGITPERLLIDGEAITEEQLAIAIAERNGLPYVDLFTFKADDGAARLIDPETARRYRALPIAVDDGGALVVALPDPMDALAVSDIGVITKSKVRTAVASDAGIEALLGTLPATRRVRLSAHGPDGAAGARAAGEWTISKISTPEATATAPDPILEPGEQPEPAPAADGSLQLEDQIEALVTAALEKRLNGGVPEAAANGDLEQAQEELARTRAELERAHGAVEALSRRIRQLETPPS